MVQFSTIIWFSIMQLCIRNCAHKRKCFLLFVSSICIFFIFGIIFTHTFNDAVVEMHEDIDETINIYLRFTHFVLLHILSSFNFNSSSEAFLKIVLSPEIAYFGMKLITRITSLNCRGLRTMWVLEMEKTINIANRALREFMTLMGGEDPRVVLEAS